MTELRVIICCLMLIFCPQKLVMTACFMVTPEFHFASVWYAASTEGDLFCFLAFLNRRSHTRGYPVW